MYLRPFEAAVRDAGLASVMNGYHELDGIAVRRQPMAADRSAARRVGLRRHGRVRLLRGQPARRLPPRRRVDGPEAAAAGAARRASTSSCPAPTATATRSARRSTRGAVAMADVDEAVRRVLDVEVPARPVRAAVRRRRTRSRVHTRTADADRARPRRSPPTASCCCATTACCRCAAPASIAVIGPNAASARNMLGDYSYVAHVESLLEVLKSGAQRVRDADRPRRRRRRRRPTSPTSSRCSTRSVAAPARRRRSATPRDAPSTTTTGRASTRRSPPPPPATSPSS